MQRWRKPSPDDPSVRRRTPSTSQEMHRQSRERLSLRAPIDSPPPSLSLTRCCRMWVVPRSFSFTETFFVAPRLLQCFRLAGYGKRLLAYAPYFLLFIFYAPYFQWEFTPLLTFYTRPVFWDVRSRSRSCDGSMPEMVALASRPVDPILIQGLSVTLLPDDI